MKLFQFDPSSYAPDFARDGFVHIRNAVTEEFYARMAPQVDELVRTKALSEFAAGDTEQAVYEFPDDSDDLEQIRSAVGAVCGLDPRELVLSERHIKRYLGSATAEPQARKDRFASEITLGISVHVPAGSTLVLYPNDELGVNPFSSSGLFRERLAPEQLPERALRKARRVEIFDAPGDAVLFRGNRIWHHRTNPANTTVLSLKLNAMNCDPLGEDPTTPAVRAATEAAAALDDQALEACVPMLGRRVEYTERVYSRIWQEMIAVVLWHGERCGVDDVGLKVLRMVDGKRTVRCVLDTLNGPASRSTAMTKIRHLALRGVLDLVERGRNA